MRRTPKDSYVVEFFIQKCDLIKVLKIWKLS